MKVLFYSVDLPIPACRITIERLDRGKVVLLPCTHIAHGDVLPCVIRHERTVFPKRGINTVDGLHTLVVVHRENTRLDDGLEFLETLTALLQKLGIARSHCSKF